jgi:hypothetical protein
MHDPLLGHVTNVRQQSEMLGKGPVLAWYAVALAPAWNWQHVLAVAFVQDAHDGVVLLAFRTGPCGDGPGL